jgi:hypothetical protein
MPKVAKKLPSTIGQGLIATPEKTINFYYIAP